ncbi:hypothetical protein GPA27_05925 [Aromatoleum toluolicum]|uniref:Uncharacterized protein n=1 Tax=Aromatoleum toluolicum TaxID=90060 RepID=A0ABX1NCH6_9RHOO|nr:hypothetical protein [Aromatoleum toluolicum]NMF96923.1 hypothetical protein [Aromatoleum toluolicum]
MSNSPIRKPALPAALVGLLIALGNGHAQAAEGDGELKIGGALRARYDYSFDNDPNISKLSFDTFRIDVNYDSSTLFGSAQYRFYGGAHPYDYTDQIGRINFPSWAWLGYKVGQDTRLVAGINQVPFGLLPYVSSTFYQSLVNAIGLEDVHNLGAKVQQKFGPLDVQVGFYPKDGGDWTGTSRDGNRYSVNVVKADSYVTGGSDNKERNLFVGRVAYKLEHGKDASSELGVSALRSTLHNEDTDDDGTRKAYAVHYGGKFGALGVLAELGRQNMSPRNPSAVGNDTVTFGAYDGSFNVASKSRFYSAEVNYALPWTFGPVSNITPYLNYSVVTKDKSGYKDSQRIIAGAHFSAGPLFIYTEMRWGRNDPYTGDYVSGAAAGGEDKWKKAFYANIGYYF